MVTFVSGATGLVGSHLIAELLKDDTIRIKVLRRKTSNLSLLKEVLSRYSHPEHKSERIEWIEGDVMDIDILKNAMYGVDTVYHCAAVVSFDPSDKDSIMRINVEGTANMVNAALQCGVRQFCHVSSIASLGHAEHGKEINEDCVWRGTENKSIYSVSKYHGEMEVWRGSTKGLPVVVVNPAVILGAGSWHSGSSELFHTVAKGLPFYTTGVNGFVDVKDVARAMVMLTDKEHFAKVCNQRFVLCGASVNYKDLFTMMARHLNVKAPYIHSTHFMLEAAWRLCKVYGKMTGKRPIITKETARSSIARHRYSSGKIIRETGFEFTPIEDTIKEICEIYQGISASQFKKSITIN